MIDIETMFISLKAAWVPRLLKSTPTIHSWSQLPYIYFKPLLECNNKLVFDIDRSVEFVYLKNIPSFYKEIFECYNEALGCNLDSFKSNILAKCIWGNKYIYVERHKKKCVLFLRNWIRSGIRYVIDLRFINGVLDVDYIYQKILNSNNIWSEVFIVRSALLPYRDLLRDIRDLTAEKQKVSYSRSKEFYNLLKEKIVSNVPYVTNYLMTYVNDTNDESIMNVYLKKIEQVKQSKLKEFNFKLIHGILPCNLNLWRWKIKISSKCDVCDSIQSLEHLLFTCKYVKPLWNIAEKLYNTNIDYDVILGLKDNHNIHFIVTVISYCIYKEWLLLSLESKNRRNCINLDFFKKEFKLRLEIYKQCTNIDMLERNQLESLVNAL